MNELRDKPRFASYQTGPEKYREAFRLYCEAPAGQEMSLTSIAAEIDVAPEALMDYAQRRNWPQLRTVALAQRSQADAGLRALQAAESDALMVKKAAGWLQTAADQLDKILAGICTLPVNDESELIRKRQLGQAVELMSEALKSVASLVEIGRNLGLVLGPKKDPGSDAGRIDFSRLTSLSVTLIEAQKQAGQQPIPVVQLETLELDKPA